MDEENTPKRPRRISVLAYGEGEDEKIFLRHLVASYSRKNLVAIQTADAGGGDPLSILNRAIRTRSGEKHDIEFILLDTDKVWPREMTSRAEEEGIILLGSSPCLEDFFLEILGTENACEDLSSWNCKSLFERTHCNSGNFCEDECERLFTKSVLNEARTRIPNLDYILKVMEGQL